jgi:hypothetical protein
MRLHILYDRTGRILAAVHLDPASDVEGVGELRPVPRKGQMSADFEVPAEHAHLDFVEACRALRVDTKNRKLIAIKGRGKLSPRRTKK